MSNILNISSCSNYKNMTQAYVELEYLIENTLPIMEFEGRNCSQQVLQILLAIPAKNFQGSAR
jgi:hypothetical protein